MNTSPPNASGAIDFGRFARYSPRAALAVGTLLACAFFLFDLHSDARYWDGALYSIAVLLGVCMPRGWGVVVLATLCSVLIVLGAVFGAEADGLTIQIVTARLISIAEVWAAAGIGYLAVRYNRRVKQTENEANAVIDTMVDGVITIDENGIIRSANKAVERIFLYTEAELVGKNLTVLMPEPYRNEHDQYLDNYKSGGQAKVIGIGREVEARRRDGAVFPIDLAVSEWTLAGKRMFTGIIRDISEGRMAKAALVDARSQTNAVIDTMVDGVITIDENGFIRSANKAVERIFQYREAELVGKNLTILMPEPYRSEHDQYLENYKSGCQAKVIGIGREVEARRRDGTVFPIDLAVSEWTTGGRRMFTGIVRDITERQEAEQALRDARQKADEANLAKSEFLANMNHELRTPLNAIIGYSEMVIEDLDGAAPKEVVADVKHINSAGRRLLSLINDILDLARLETKRTHLNRDFIATDTLVEGLEDTFVGSMAARGNTFRLRLGPDLGHMYCDAAKIRQVLLGLLDNAMKFTENGEVVLGVERATENEKDVVVFSVKDTGIGISAESLQLIFRDFAQADGKTTRRYGGNGLGLAIVKRICEIMGGRVDVESEPGVGSTFRVTLPAVPSEHRAVAAEDEIFGTARPQNGSRRPELERKTILVVDDDPAARDLISRTLANEGYRIMFAKTGRSALETARAVKPDVMTLDVLMPDLDGWSVLATLKSDPSLADVPIVMCTVVDDPEASYSLGASGFLVKPFDRKQLIKALEPFRETKGERPILVVDGDTETREAVRRSLEKLGWRVAAVGDGVSAMRLLQFIDPALILLDLTVPKLNGFELIEALQRREGTRHIPIVVVSERKLSEVEEYRLNKQVRGIVDKRNRQLENVVADIQVQVTACLEPLQ